MGDLVLQLELALLEPLHLELVQKAVLLAGFNKRIDRSIEIAMLDPEGFQPFAKFLFGHPQPSMSGPTLCPRFVAHKSEITDSRSERGSQDFNFMA